MTDPLYIERDGHRTWLKWHRGRRTASDPVFTGSRILEALHLGASVEVDLVVTADGNFAILHDHTLDRETTGQGPVNAAADAAIRQLTLRDNDGMPIPEPVMLLDDLCRLAASRPRHPDALLQLDLKENRDSLSARAVKRFAQAVVPIASSIILSSGDAAAVDLLHGVVRDMRIGFDASDGDRVEAALAEGGAEAFTQWALAASPGSSMFYLHWEIVTRLADAGEDVVAAFHRHGKRIDAWTIRTVDETTIPQVQRLLDLKVDQITTDDPQRLKAALDP